MALTAGSSAIWTDITAIYDTLRTIQSAHGLTQTTIPTNSAGTSIKAADIITLNNAAAAAHEEGHLKTAAYTTVANPSVGTAISASLVTTIKTNVDNMSGIAHFGFSFCSFGECGGFGDGYWF